MKRQTQQDMHAADTYPIETQQDTHEVDTYPINTQQDTQEVDTYPIDAQTQAHLERTQGQIPPHALPMNLQRRRVVVRWRRYAVRICAVLVLLGCVLGLAAFARPAVSHLENRTLTAFPSLSNTDFADGSFFTQVSLWYADTFPFRDALVGTSRSIQGLYGVQPSVQMIGGNRESDALPVLADGAQEVASDASSGEGEASSTSSVPQEGGRTARKPVALPEARAAAQEMEGVITDGIYIADGACYTLYYFDQDATQAYVDVINDAADQLKDTATVYSVLLPTNAGVMLSENTLASLGVPSQNQAIDYFYSLMDTDVVTVETFDVLHNHKDEYLYFRTDHHWTQLAAYYVYVSFCTARGVQPADYESWKELVFEPYWGEYSSYVDIQSIAQADSVHARIPEGTDEMEYWDNDLDESSRSTGDVITDINKLEYEENAYNCFVCGNRALSHIHNGSITDGSSCLLIKDSFGNPFASLLAGSYEDVYTLDFRYSSLNIVDFVKDHNIKDVIFENVIMFAGTYACSDSLAALTSPDNVYTCDFAFQGVDE